MKRFWLILGILGAGLLTAAVPPATPAQAATAADWNAGRIIDDYIFVDKNSMSVQDIQNFLNTKVPTCQTNHAPDSTSGGSVPPWKCLKDYYENVDTGANNLNGNPLPAGSISAAQIIHRYAQQYSINPKVLLVTLQKEAGLITDTWPYPSQYRTAMGFACPDTASCNPAYYGFGKQVYQAARYFRNFYEETPGWTVPHKVGTRSIRYSPNINCGSGTVEVTTHGTAALYSYTPYQPNAASLAAGYGTGDGCSTYGNRNFAFWFNDWFGSPNGGAPTSAYIKIVGPITSSPASPIPGQAVTINYTVKNTSSSPITFQNSVLQCRVNTTGNCDPPWNAPVSLAAGEERTLSSSYSTLQAGGNYVFTPFFQHNNVWYRYSTDYGIGNSLPMYVPAYVADVRLVGAITTSPAAPIPGETVTVTYTIRNVGNNQAIFQNSVLQCRINANTSCDPPWNPPVTLAMGAQQTFTNTFVARAGTYWLTPYYQQNGNWYRYGSDPGVPSNRVLDIPVYVADMRLVGTINVSPAQPVPGQTVTVTHTVKNFGNHAAILPASVLQCRINAHTGCDPAWNPAITLNTGEQTTYTNTFVVRAGTYWLTPYYLQNGSWYRYGSDPGVASNHILNVPAYVADMRLVGPITSSPAQPTAGQSATISYTIKNFGTIPAILQNSVLQCRLNTYTGCDPAWNAPVTLNPGEQRVYTNTFTVRAGSYWFTPFFMQNETWYRFGSDTASGIGNALPLTVR